MRRLEIPSLYRLHDILSYNPQTGDLTWRIDRPPGAKAGQLVGTLDNRTGTLSCRIDGRRYQLHHLIWYMDRQVWPTHHILFRDKDPTNLALHNLYSGEEAYSQTPKAVSARRRRELWEQRQARAQAMKVSAAATGDYQISYAARDRCWIVYDPNDARRILQRFDTREAAEEYVLERHRIDAFVRRHNEEFRLKPGDDLIRAGTALHAETYAEIAALIVYDPDTGQFYYRNIDRLGGQLRADFTATTGRQVVTLFSRYFSVAMLAWFLTYRQWPRPKSIGWRNGDPKNNRLSNLMLLKAQR